MSPFVSDGCTLSDLAFEAVNGAHAQPNQLGGLDNASALCQLLAGGFKLVGFGTRAAELGAHDAASGLKLAVAGELFADDLQSSPHPLLDHRPLELGESAGDLEQQLAGRGGGIEVLLIKVGIDADGSPVFDSF